MANDPRRSHRDESSEALPGDPREAQQPQEPRSTHVGDGRESEGMGTGPGRESSPAREPERGEDRGVVEQLRQAWDRIRGRD